MHLSKSMAITRNGGGGEPFDPGDGWFSQENGGFGGSLIGFIAYNNGLFLPKKNGNQTPSNKPTGPVFRLETSDKFDLSGRSTLPEPFRIVSITQEIQFWKQEILNLISKFEKSTLKNEIYAFFAPNSNYIESQRKIIEEECGNLEKNDFFKKEFVFPNYVDNNLTAKFAEVLGELLELIYLGKALADAKNKLSQTQSLGSLILRTQIEKLLNSASRIVSEKVNPVLMNFLAWASVCKNQEYDQLLSKLCYYIKKKITKRSTRSDGNIILLDDNYQGDWRF